MAPKGPQDPERLRALEPQAREDLVYQCALLEGVLCRRPGHVEAMQALAEIYTTLGFYQDGLALDREIVERRPRDPVAAYNLACSQALTGDADGALESLERAMELGYKEREHMAHDPDLSSLHGDARFVALLRGERKHEGST